ncbi:PREDICTED: uncharacterized protein LOC103336132 [Prunus mume]|uniref:PROPEP1 n=1 Tax=Prunus mume TaxID=102107 RepID=A0A823A8W8_PRUMU|nr:PREDICTED: uncharacterized protein LOC103336132 [Prunus mume]DAD54772.1 TPA_inf: PROPEP1 [Prunus mume]
MECSQVSTDDGEAEVKEKRGVSYNFYLHPCHFLEEAVRAFFKCLGIENRAQEEDDGQKDTETNPNKIAPSTSQVELQDDAADPSVTATDTTEADPAPSSTTTQTSEVAGSLRAVRPPITTGGGGQIN